VTEAMRIPPPRSSAPRPPPLPPQRSRRGGHRPNSGRRRGSVERDPDRFFVVLWRVLFRLLHFGPYTAGSLAAFLVGAEPILIEDVANRRRRASTSIPNHAASLEARIDSLVRKAKRSSDADPWIWESETFIRALILTWLVLARPNPADDTRDRLNNDVKELVADLVGLGWGEFWSRLQTRIGRAPQRSSSA
jgi:hypothetical protein